MTKLRATIKESTITTLELEAPDDMTLEELNKAAEEGELLDYCKVLSETPDDVEGNETNIYEFNGQPVNEEDNNYDAGHAAEWMEMHPHGYYNSETDKGTGE